MGKPIYFYRSLEFIRGGARSELKHLSRSRKINHRDCVSKRRAKAQKPKLVSQDAGVAGQIT